MPDIDIASLSAPTWVAHSQDLPNLLHLHVVRVLTGKAQVVANLRQRMTGSRATRGMWHVRRRLVVWGSHAAMHAGIPGLREYEAAECTAHPCITPTNL